MRLNSAHTKKPIISFPVPRLYEESLGMWSPILISCLNRASMLVRLFVPSLQLLSSASSPPPPPPSAHSASSGALSLVTPGPARGSQAIAPALEP